MACNTKTMPELNRKRNYNQSKNINVDSILYRNYSFTRNSLAGPYWYLNLQPSNLMVPDEFWRVRMKLRAGQEKVNSFLPSICISSFLPSICISSFFSPRWWFFMPIHDVYPYDEPSVLTWTWCDLHIILSGVRFYCTQQASKRVVPYFVLSLYEVFHINLKNASAFCDHAGHLRVNRRVSTRNGGANTVNFCLEKRAYL